MGHEFEKNIIFANVLTDPNDWLNLYEYEEKCILRIVERIGDANFL